MLGKHPIHMPTTAIHNVCVRSQLLSHVLLFVLLFSSPWTIAHQAPLSMGFPRQEYWSGLPFPSPGDLPDPGIKSRSPARGLNRFSCVQLCNAMDFSLPGSSVHGILQARILEWVAIPSCRGSSPPRNRTRVSCVSCTGRQILYHCVT